MKAVRSVWERESRGISPSAMRRVMRIRAGCLSAFKMVLGFAVSLVCVAEAETETTSLRQFPQVVRHAAINPDVPIFVPVHPRIATTITFPKPIGEPVGTGFIDSELAPKSAEKAGRPTHGEYVISYAQGDAFFTVQPLPKSELLNLNVPYEGSTLVFYFYLVDQPLQALASLILNEKAGKSTGTLSSTPEPFKTTGAACIEKRDTEPVEKFRAATPARLDGFLRKLRMIHAAKTGEELSDVATAMKLSVAVSSAEDPVTTNQIQPVSEGQGFQIILLRAVRDSSLDTVGFIVLLKNTSKVPIVFDLRTFSARCGAALYSARVIDAPARLEVGEMRPGYFAIVGSGDGRPGYLLPDNDWRLSLARADQGLSPENTPHP